MTLISVAVCTHNPRPDYIRRCVAALESQTLSRERWELLLIDNASAAGREPCVDLAWHPQARTIREDRLGLTPARLRAIREAAGDLLVFVDDDNVLDADFLATALETEMSRPFLGAWSGQCRPEFAATPPEWTRRYWGSLVIREFDRDVWSNLPRLAETMPCGAGLCVRRSVALEYVKLHDSGRRGFQFDRTGDTLVSGGDNDLAGTACTLGLGVGLVSALRLTHLIPEDRLTLAYLTRLVEGIHFSGALLDALYGVDTPPPSIARRLAARLRKPLLGAEASAIARAEQRGRSRATRLIVNGGLHEGDRRNR